jgi:hypothetical protein
VGGSSREAADHPRFCLCVLDLVFNYPGGRRSGVVVPDLGPLLFEGVRSGTLETERSRPPAPGHGHFSGYSRGAQLPDVRAVWCAGAVRPLRGPYAEVPLLVEASGQRLRVSGYRSRLETGHAPTLRDCEGIALDRRRARIFLDNLDAVGSDPNQ